MFTYEKEVVCLYDLARTFFLEQVSEENGVR